MASYTPVVNELASSHPKFTDTIHRDVYPAIEPSKPELALSGKTVLITGAGRGLGVGFVESFAKAQVKTIILSGRSEASLASTVAKFEKTYPSVQFIPIVFDLGSPESVDSLFNGLKATVDRIDILVSNAGINDEFGKNIGDTDINKWWDIMTINVRGPYLLARALINFNPPEYPTTFITLSTGINEEFTGMSGYWLSKTIPTKMVSLLFAEYPNIRAFAVNPGLVATDMMVESFLPLAQDTPALVGGLAVYLSHPHADFLSGRFISAHWDVEQIQSRKDEIITKNLLKVEIGGW